MEKIFVCEKCGFEAVVRKGMVFKKFYAHQKEAHIYEIKAVA